MARITISVNADNADGDSQDQDLITLDVPLGMTLAAFKSTIQSETNFPATTQTIFHNGQTLRDDSQTLEQAGLKDGEMLAVLVSRGPPQPRQAAPRALAQPSVAEPDSNRIEQIRQSILANPEHMTGLIRENPDLANVIENPAEFRRLWQEMAAAQRRGAQQRRDETQALNDDLFNPEAQLEIERRIRQQQIEANIQYALEHNPAVFGTVTMLYVPVKVNGYDIKAFVDSGAQTTIMSPSCAKACGISHLIDTRFGGIAKGVGTARILGRVLQTPIQIGDAELDCAFTVTDQDMDLLFGLDMLKRHQACIDLQENKLKFPLTEVQFLGESELPKKDIANLVDEPTVPGPDGTEVGAKTGTVRPKGAAATAHESLQKAEKVASEAARPMAARPAAAGASSSTSRASRFPDADIAQLVGLGFTREEALQALDATGGNIEFAASWLFQR